MEHSSWSRRIRTALAVLACTAWAASVMAQGVTTGAMTGVAVDSQGGVLPGATVSAVHVPSGTKYEAVTQEDGHFIIPAMRVGGPYTVTVELQGLGAETKNDLQVSLGTSADLQFVLKVAGVQESVSVVANAIDPTFGSQRTGAATAVNRTEIARLPTVSGRINDITRLTPQAGSGGTFGGVDNRMNNISVDGSYFNNSFGLAGQPGDRTGVAPISLESIEEVQVSLAPYDVRQGAFVGASVNTVTRSGTNKLVGSFYHRTRNESYVGTEAAGQPFNPGDFETKTTGGWVGGPIIKNRLFAFGSYESQTDKRPLNTFLANPGGAAAAGNTTRVLASDLNRLSSYLSSNFDYETGAYENLPDETPGKPLLIKGDYNVNSNNKVTFRYNQLSSDTDVNLSGSSSLGNGRQTFTTNFLNYESSNYTILENIKSGIGEWNSVLGTSMSNNLIIGYSKQDESRGAIENLFPFVDILDGSNVTYTSFGSEPFTPNNELRYNTFQLQDSFQKFFRKHSLVFGVSVEKYRSENVFYPGAQSAYVYNTLDDFYADANGYLTNPNRTTSPINLRRFQVRYINLPGLDKPTQPLDVWYSGGYVQDNWRVRSNLTINAGVRVDFAKFGETAFANAAVDALTFRDQNGQAVQYSTGALPAASPLWSPRVGFNLDVFSNQKTQLRGGTGVFTGKPPYVWISNQIGNTGVLTGFTQDDNVTTRPFNPNPDAYKPAPTGVGAASVDLAVTDPDFKFPQIWRTNIGVDHRLPGGIIATGDFIYNRDVNGAAYINANLPAPQSAYLGVDARPRWVGPACGTGTVGGCINRINNAPFNQVTQAMVLQNQDVGRNWNVAFGLSKAMTAGFSIRGAYSYGKAENLVDPGSVAAGSWTTNAIVNDPNNPVLALSSSTPGHRYYITATYSKEYFKFGATTVSAFWDARPVGNNVSYVFSGDMNGDSASGNDLIYIPRNISEMNFQTFTESGRTFTADEQAAAFENFIQLDPYLSQHRGEYAERNGAFLKMVGRMDLSIMQDVFKSIGGRRHSGQIRLDVQNFGNLLNSDWGVGERVVQNQILTNAATDASGRLTYRMARVGGVLPATPRQSTALINDVYTLMLSFRYSFNY